MREGATRFVRRVAAVVKAYWRAYVAGLGMAAIRTSVGDWIFGVVVVCVLLSITLGFVIATARAEVPWEDALRNASYSDERALVGPRRVLYAAVTAGPLIGRYAELSPVGEHAWRLRSRPSSKLRPDDVVVPRLSADDLFRLLAQRTFGLLDENTSTAVARSYFRKGRRVRPAATLNVSGLG